MNNMISRSVCNLWNLFILQTAVIPNVFQIIFAIFNLQYCLCPVLSASINYGCICFTIIYVWPAFY